MVRTSLLTLVDERRFRELFVDHLGWSTPDQPTKSVEVDGHTYTLTQVARFEGLRVWWCDQRPELKTQRRIDAAIAKDDIERLVIFTGGGVQQWRWPRRPQTGGVPAKLLVHEHTDGEPDEHLSWQLEAIRLKVSDNVNLVSLLRRMRAAFDQVAESNSVKAARLMNTLFAELKACGVGEHEATLLLARLLFLMFGDDSMWAKDQFKSWLENSTTAGTLNDDLTELFDVLNTDTNHRSLPAGSVYAEFRYINGGLFKDPVRLPALSDAFRTALVEACEFDWSGVSPAVFGSMFQTVKDKDARRLGGEHYTTEKNILKTLGPLFLDELHERFEKVRDDKAGLTKLHNHLGRLRVMDPACGCGNFLIVAYRELRSLELDVMRQRRSLDQDSGEVWEAQRSMLSTDFEVKVRLDHFAGIEIDEWPAQIARTAMLLVDHQANQQMAEDFAEVPDRLPIRIAPRIEPTNALTTDWSTIVPPSEDVIIVGNPPFIGQYTKTAGQTVDAKAVWGSRYNGYLDYVTAWYAKTIDYFGTVDGRWAFVSTNSVSQGEATEYLWRPILDAGWRCRFAHRSFEWTTESLKRDGAVVHVSIIGFDRKVGQTAELVEYEYGGKGEGRAKEVKNINPYLLDAPNVFVHSVTRPLPADLPRAIYGSKPTDDKNLLISAAEIEDVMRDPIAAQYVRRFVGARELLHGVDRWCLWMPTVTDAEIAASPVLRERVAAVKQFREDSTDSGTQRAALRPHLFQYDRQPTARYLAIPRHVSETRAYFIPAYLEPDVICGDANFLVADPTGFAFGILASSMFTAWMRAIGGRIKSDLRFANTFSYNTFPLPVVSEQARAQIQAAAIGVAAAREAQGGASLASLYTPGRMAPDLKAAHDALDVAVDALFGVTPGLDELARQRLLLDRYAQMTKQAVLI